MEIYQRPGWSHPSPIINPGQPEAEEIVDSFEDEVLEETTEEKTEEQI